MLQFLKGDMPTDIRYQTNECNQHFHAYKRQGIKVIWQGVGFRYGHQGQKDCNKNGNKTNDQRDNLKHNNRYRRFGK